MTFYPVTLSQRINHMCSPSYLKPEGAETCIIYLQSAQTSRSLMISKKDILLPAPSFNYLKRKTMQTQSVISVLQNQNNALPQQNTTTPST